MKPTLRPGQRAPERVRDEDESDFTPILRQAWRADPSTKCVLFVDREGECIDYVSAIDPYQAKLVGAHGLLLLDACGEVQAPGEPQALVILTAGDILWVQRVSGDYAVVVLADSDADEDLMGEVLRDACQALRAEGAIGVPTGTEARGEQAPAAGSTDDPNLHVQVRKAVGWPYAPAVIGRGATRIAIAAVMGRWTEDDPVQGAQICFRVRTEEGRELTLSHLPSANRWQVFEG